mgnify:CR=1 FL=1
MGAGKSIKHILLDKNITITALAEKLEKPRQTVANTLFRDNMEIRTAAEYGKALGCGLYFIDEENGYKYPINID